MVIAFLTLSRFTDVSERGIYSDLVRKFCKEGHHVVVISPLERKFKGKTHLKIKDNLWILKVRTLNIQKSGLIEKGIAYLLLEYQFIKAIRESLEGLKFDLILYSTPPITFSKVVKYLKNKNDAKTYLLLKDIFPQGAVDIGLLNKKSFIYKFFRRKELELYEISDYIGCMSEANVRYVIDNNSILASKEIEVNPNSIEPREFIIDEEIKFTVREKLKISPEAVVFIYGGNLGKSQGLDFYLEILKSRKNDKGVFFITAGSGSEFTRLKLEIRRNGIKNAIIFNMLKKSNYEKLLLCSDVGLIFLDSRFSIPNFPSRVLSYMEMKLPVVAAIDQASDMGEIISSNGFGYKLGNGDLKKFDTIVDSIKENRKNLKIMGSNGYDFLKNNYTVEQSYLIIMKHFR